LFRFVGSYKCNTTGTGEITLKNYYLSQRITYNWIDSFLSCKSVGMRLAYIESKAEINNLGAIAKHNPKLFARKIFIDGHDLTDAQSPPTEQCYSVQKYARSKLEIRLEECTGKTQKFLCEKFEVVDNYEDPFPNNSLDVKETFLNYLGKYEAKTYYVNSNIQTSQSNAHKICQSLDMRIASPQNQDEFENLHHLLRIVPLGLDDIVIAGYRSEENGNDWVSSNNNLNYDVEWSDDQPSNANSDKHCIAIRRYNLKLKNIRCSYYYPFICELDASVKYESKFNEIEFSRYLKPLTSYNIGSENSQLFLSVYEANWPSAIITCKNFGMELLTPKSEEEEAILRKKLNEDVKIPSPLHVGATAIGTDEKLEQFYAFHTGKVFNFDLEWQQKQNYDAYENECLRLLRSDKKFHFGTVDCVNSTSHFICQKISEKTNEGIETISSPSPVLL